MTTNDKGEQPTQEVRQKRERERFEKRLDSELKRSEGKRLSQSTIRRLISSDTASWAQSLLAQKATQSQIANIIPQINQYVPTSSITTTQSSITDTFGDRQPAAMASTSGTPSSGAGLPDGAMAKRFDVCENGTPRNYWFVVWDQQPSV